MTTDEINLPDINIFYKNQQKALNQSQVSYDSHNQKQSLKLNVTNEQFDFVIKEKYQRMIRDKHEIPSLLIPKNFKNFIFSQEFLKFIKKIYNYCQTVSSVQKKLDYLQEESKIRAELPPGLLNQEQIDIQEKAKDICQMYSLIILKYSRLNVLNQDQNFFETMIYFIGQVLREFFIRADYQLVEEEINRLFRTNIFNIIKRRHIEDNRINQYPVLRENQHKQPIENILDNLKKRSKVPDQKLNSVMQQEKSNLRPLFVKNTPLGSVNCRSPLIALLLPAKKESLFQLSENQRKRVFTQYDKPNTQNNQIKELMKYENNNKLKKISKYTALDLIKKRSQSQQQTNEFQYQQ